MYWESVLKEVLQKRKNAAKHDDPIKKKNKHADLRRYFLGKKHPGKYFTKREAQCMLLILKGKTINKTAEALGLSPRTVEFYLKNMKIKLRCRTKYELIEIVQNSEFTQNLSSEKII